MYRLQDLQDHFLQDLQDHLQDHQNHLQEHLNHPYKEPPLGGSSYVWF